MKFTISLSHPSTLHAFAAMLRHSCTPSAGDRSHRTAVGRQRNHRSFPVRRASPQVTAQRPHAARHRPACAVHVRHQRANGRRRPPNVGHIADVPALAQLAQSHIGHAVRLQYDARVHPSSAGGWSAASRPPTGAAGQRSALPVQGEPESVAACSRGQRQATASAHRL